MWQRAAAAAVIGLLACGSAGAAEIIMAREAAVDLKSPYLPVCLDGYANDARGEVFPSARVTVQGIPFDLVTAEGCDNLFLHEAGWPDWAATACPARTASNNCANCVSSQCSLNANSRSCSEAAMSPVNVAEYSACGAASGRSVSRARLCLVMGSLQISRVGRRTVAPAIRPNCSADCCVVSAPSRAKPSATLST